MRRFAPNGLIDDTCPPVAGPFSFAATAWCFFWLDPKEINIIDLISSC
jgi:hypothetical protein